MAHGKGRPCDDIRIPKGVRPYMPDWAEETILGEPQGSLRQYRYGNLHIREYGDWYTAHTDRIDPRKDPLGHLVRDAPEVLIGAGCALAAGALVHAALGGRGAGDDNNDCRCRRRALIAVATATAAAAASGCAAYAASKRIRRALAGPDGGR